MRTTHFIPLTVAALLAAMSSLPGGCASSPHTSTVEKAKVFRAHLAEGDYDKARRLMSDSPRRWFDGNVEESTPWTVGPGPSGPWAHWDEHFRKQTEIVGWKGDDHSATLTFRETNDYFQLVDRGWVTTQAVYSFDDRGRIDGLEIRAIGERPPGRTEEFLDWARANAPDELEYLRPGGEIDPGGDRPQRHRDMLNRWRSAIGLPTIE